MGSRRRRAESPIPTGRAPFSWWDYRAGAGLHKGWGMRIDHASSSQVRSPTRLSEVAEGPGRPQGVGPEQAVGSRPGDRGPRLRADLSRAARAPVRGAFGADRSPTP